MRKKIIAFVTALFIISVIAVPLVYAAENSTTKDKTFDFKSMFDTKRDQINNALEKGEITKEEAQKWLEHIDSMQKFHETNGIGLCHGQNGGMMGGRGTGMMGKF